MGTIFSGVGLNSGLDIQALVSQLLAVEARPRDNILARIGKIDLQRTALADLTARVTALRGEVTKLKARSYFEASSIQSSNNDALSAISSGAAAPGAYSFIVRALASTHQLVSQGFASGSSTLTPGTFSLESVKARVNPNLRLDDLNGGAGVQRGAFQLTDSTGKQAVVNINDALTLADVVQRINSADVGVRATVRDDRLVVTDELGGEVKIRELNGGKTAAQLGFGPGNVNGQGELVGGNLMYLSATTALNSLNDGIGVRRSLGGADFKVSGAFGEFTVDLSAITKPETRLERLNHGAGVALGKVRITGSNAAEQPFSTEVDLTGATTLGEVKAKIESAVPGVLVTMTSSRLIVSNADNKERPLEVVDVDSTAARDLGINGSSATGKINGRDVLKVDSIRDIVAAINYATGNTGGVTAAISEDGGQSLTFSGAGNFTLTALNGGSLRDLGFAAGEFSGSVQGARIVGGVDSVLLRSLNGGQGFSGSSIQIAGNGGNISVDVSGAETLQDVVEAINSAAQAAGIDVEAGYDSSGTRITLANLRDTTPLSITGDFAESIGLAQTGSAVRSANLQRQYITENTRLSDLNAGRGVAQGKIRLTNSSGLIFDVDLGGAQTMGDVIKEINAANAGIVASINERGDGLLLTDTAGGGGKLKVEEDGSTTARDLHLLGESDNSRIDGSYEVNIEVSGSDSLDTIIKQINEKAGFATASLVNDGSPNAPYRLALSAVATGAAGELLVDGDLFGGFTTLSKAQDAALLIGSSDTGGILVTSSSNTLDNVVPGLKLNLVSASDDPVTVSVNRDFNALLTTMKKFADDYNALTKRLTELGSYNPDTERAGVLLGDAAVRNTENRMRRLVTDRIPGSTGALRRLADLGFKLGEGAQLSFDEEKFRAAYEADPQAVIDFFAREETGAAIYIEEQLKGLTEENGIIKKRETSLAEQKETFSNRVDALNQLLEFKRNRYMRQFLAMERALGQLQSQQSSLQTLSALAASVPKTK